MHKNGGLHSIVPFLDGTQRAYDHKFPMALIDTVGNTNSGIDVVGSTTQAALSCDKESGGSHLVHELSPRATTMRAKGFTLVELMVTIAVAAILLVIAVPSFSSIINSNRLKTTANTLIGSLNAARMAAVQRNVGVQFCSNSATSNTSDTLGAACGTNAGAVFTLPSPSASTAIPLQVAPSELSISSIQIHGTIAAIRFNGQGQGFTAGTSTPVDGTVADICSTSLSTSNHIQVSMAAGSVITTTTSTSACP